MVRLPDHLLILTRILVVIWLLLLPAPFVSSAHVVTAAEEQGVFELWVSIFYGLWLSAGFLLVNLLLGRSILVRLGIAEEVCGGLLFEVFSLGSGLFVSYCFLLTLAILGALSVWAVVVCLVVVSIYILFSCYLAHKKYSVESSLSTFAVGRPVVPILVFPIAFLLLGPYLIQLLFPNSDWDVASYHLPLVKRIIEQGVWAVDPAFEQFNFAAAGHLFYSVFILLGSKEAIPPFNFALTLFLMSAVYGFAFRFWGSLRQ